MSKAYLEQTGTEPQKSFNIKLPYPKLFTLKCIECEFGRSKDKGNGEGNNPMFTRTWEVVAPERVKIKNDKGEMVEVVVQGLKCMDWLTMTAKTGKIVLADSERLGVEPPDDELPNPQAYLGKEGKAILRTNAQPRVDPDDGTPICDSKGTPVVGYQHNIAEWIN